MADRAEDQPNVNAPPAEAAPASVTPEPPASVPVSAETGADTAPVAAPLPDGTGAEPSKLEVLTQPTLLDEFDAAEKAKAEPPKAEEPKVEAKPEGDAEKPAEPKPEEKPADPAEKPTEAPVEEPKADEPAPLDAVDYFETVKLPETIKIDDAQKVELGTALDAFRRNPQDIQGLVDFYNKSMTAFAEHSLAEQTRVWNETRAEWRKDAMADPVIGGAGHNTEMKKIATVRDAFVSSAKPGTKQYETDMADWTQLTQMTGIGDNPTFLRFLHNAFRYVREADVPPPDPKPTKDAGKQPGRRGKIEYTHPSSQTGA